MNVRALHGKQLFAAVVFVAATVVLAIRLLSPSPVMISVGENGAEVAELGKWFQPGRSSHRCLGDVARRKWHVSGDRRLVERRLRNAGPRSDRP
jgi:hypothetical protein